VPPLKRGVQLSFRPHLAATAPQRLASGCLLGSCTLSALTIDLVPGSPRYCLTGRELASNLHIPLAFHLPIHSSNPHQRIPPNNAGRLRFLFAIFARVCHGRRGLHYDFALDIRIYFIGLERRQITSRKASIHHAQAAAHFVVVVSYPGIRQGNARSANTHFPIASQPAAHAIPAAQPSACPKIQP
jgi:hypothetical protein